MTQNKKKGNGKQRLAIVLFFAFFMSVGGACGILMVRYIDATATADRSSGEEWLALLGLFLSMYIALFLQLVIHEAGHLAFGLRSGYRFSSFRIGSFIWVKEEGGLKMRRLSVAGTGGQCLMAPPDPVDGTFPVILYNLGGSLLNVISALIFLGLYFLVPRTAFLSVPLLMLAVMGGAIAVMNGVPMRLGTVDNDGYNALSLGKNETARNAFWTQLKVNEEIAKGNRLKDMPEEWFAIPAEGEMGNSLVASQAVSAVNRLMDSHRFEEAELLMDRLLEQKTAMAGLHRSLMLCDKIYCALLREEDKKTVDELLTKEQRKFMKSMKQFPSVLRTWYVYALLAERDGEKGEKIKARFEKCAKSYPYPSDIASERELMELIAVN